jgi:hypothetical protein
MCSTSGRAGRRNFQRHREWLHFLLAEPQGSKLEFLHLPLSTTNLTKRWEETFAFQIDQPTDITGIAFDASTSRLIICSSGGRIVAWGATRNESNRMHLSKVFSRQINNFEPRSITFAGFDSSKDKDILLFGENQTGPM